ncbi:MAG: VWA domain-containing protein [Acidobacteria bacterium]|nr:VWA domain-containing protein [Acidobacteriota bacterium]
MNSRTIATLIPIILYLNAALPAQDPVFRVSSRLVEISVIADGADGKLVSDLKKEDFSLFEDGKPQQLSHCFTAASLESAGPPPVLPKGVFSNRPELLPHSPRTVTAIIIDYLNTPWSAQTATREQLLRFLRTLEPSDVVALYTMGTELNILHDYTTDRKSLIDQLSKSPGLLSLRSRNDSELINLSASRWERAFGENSARADNASRATLQRSRTLLTLDSLATVARHLAGLPGRKNLVLMSAGFPLSILPQTETTVKVIMSETKGLRIDNMPIASSAMGSGEASLFLDTMNRVINTVNTTGVSIYGVDVLGLIVPISSAEGGSTFEIANRDLASFSPVSANHASLAELSARTGGLATLRSNDIEGSLRRALNDARYAYTLAYYTPNDRLDGKPRRIEIRTNRPGVKLRYRNIYTPIDETRTASAAKGELQNALSSPISQNSLLLTAQLQPAENGQFHLALQIESRQLSLKENGGQWTGSVDILLYQGSLDGKLRGQQISLPLKLDANSYKSVLQKGLILRKTLTREKDARYLRIVVRDASSGNIGTLDARLESL